MNNFATTLKRRRKMKLFVYATELEQVLKGSYEWSMTVSSRDDIESGGWILLGAIEFDLNMDRTALTKKAIDALEEQIEEVKARSTAAVTLLESRQQNLLALTSQPPE